MRPSTTIASRLRSLKGDGLSLEHFVLRAEILKAYRAAVRTTRPLPDSQTRRETLDWMRSDLDRLREIRDISTIRDHLSSFLRTQKQFGPSLGLSVAGFEDDQPPGPDGRPVIKARLVGRKRQEGLLTRRFLE